MIKLRRLNDTYIVGKVVKGKQLGRMIGFPTANLSVPEDFEFEVGVYGVYVYHYLKKYIGLMNVGIRPSFNDGNHKSYEVHILDFDGCIYDQNLSVEVIFFIRSEQKFNDVHDLKKQLQADAFFVRQQFCIKGYSKEAR